MMNVNKKWGKLCFDQLGKKSKPKIRNIKINKL